MNKVIGNVVVLLCIIFIAAYFIYNASLQRDNFSEIDRKLVNLKLIDKDLNIYIKNSLKYDNFDKIQKEVDLYMSEYEFLEQNGILKNIDINNFQNLFTDINKKMLIKFDILEEFKSYRAILNNSFRIMQKLQTKDIDNKFHSLNMVIMTIDKNPNIDIKNLLLGLDNYKINNKYEKYFLQHSKIILEYQLKYNSSKLDLDALNIDKKLDTIYKLYDEYIQKACKKKSYR